MITYDKLWYLTYDNLSKVMISYDKRVAVYPVQKSLKNIIQSLKCFLSDVRENFTPGPPNFSQHMITYDKLSQVIASYDKLGAITYDNL